MTRVRQRTLFKGKTCVYCHGPANTKDHVPPRCLLEEPFPDNLMTVDSCEDCNGGFSDDEEYFHAALAHVGFVPSLLARVERGGSVDRSLEHSAGLDALIVASLVPGEDGRVYFMPDFARINAVVRKVAVGLHYRRYRRFYRPSAFASLGVFHARGLPPGLMALTHTERFRPKKWSRFQPGIFEYIFVRESCRADLVCIMNFHDTLWGAVRCPAATGPRRVGGSRRSRR